MWINAVHNSDVARAKKKRRKITVAVIKELINNLDKIKSHLTANRLFFHLLRVF